MNYVKHTEEDTLQAVTASNNHSFSDRLGLSILKFLWKSSAF